MAASVLHDWKFDVHAPLGSHSPVYPLVCSGAYLAVVILFKMRKPAPLGEFKLLSQLHNMFLTLLSVAMAVGVTVAAYERSLREGSAEWIVCEHPDTKLEGPVAFWLWVFYVSKTYEFLDTGIQMLRGRVPRHFTLHVFHHAVVQNTTYLWAKYPTSLSVPGMLANSSVHVIMYSYYYLASIGRTPWWKPYVTYVQVIQFLTSIVCLFWMVSLQLRGRECAGSWITWISVVFNTMLLYGFIGVLRANSRAAKAKKEASPKAA
eukprot:CAMPEP_0198419560 /NCGR_PEP_ID=MMETSP1452-20131203/290_1 /TAXON_ID=1181717 /ORGANISM="Synchroma pusillum, Strain CCMP3072" /LENGTH=261 /DNA_ID=CAMNT_0044139693 /DNA_START=8 /DNA_END=793 /DNA_ORIENTATION=-